MIVDSYYYGRLAIAPLNAVLYNVFNTYGGPELYGIEGKAYYIINLLLNFNLLLFATFASLPMLVSRNLKIISCCVHKTSLVLTLLTLTLLSDIKQDIHDNKET